ncbi:MAG: crossover junction endodeoxyribonuclease RuvC [Candidatus Coatesbacteria bacterium]|nr:crossover junction endodeoxyribonuclease RuvC [Candidatus Coatesbacteria bacterium]
MRVLGVDPSCRSTGYGVVERGDRGEVSLVKYGTIPVRQRVSLPKTLEIIHSELKAIMAEFQPDVVSMEAVFYAQNVQSAFKLGAVRGVAMLAAETSGVPVVEYSTTSIKLAVAGFGRATKESVQKMVKVALNMERVPTPDDAADALAAAICHINTSGLRERVEASTVSSVKR